MTPEESIRRLDGSRDTSCENGCKLRIRISKSGITEIATYNNECEWWEFVDVKDPFCPNCGADVPMSRVQL